MSSPWATQNYFQQVPDSQFFHDLLEGLERPMDGVKRIRPGLEQFFSGKHSQGSLRAARRSDSPERGFQQEYTQQLEEDFIDHQLNIFIGQGTLVEAGATIKPYSVVESGCQIRQGAYIRGDFYAGQGSVIGHTTEVKNTVFFNHVEAGHFTYVGDSLIGANSNLGAGTKVSNLEFRSFEEKQQEIFPELFLPFQGEILATGLSKFGAILGEGTETGCNSVISPLVLLGRNSWVLPNLCLPKGVYPPDSKLYSYHAATAARF